MPGLWGPQGGPGSIWKINSASGQVSLLANVTFNGRPNSGAALGGLAYDPGSKSLYVSDRETGLIYQFDLSGNQRNNLRSRRYRPSTPKVCRPWLGPLRRELMSRVRNSTARNPGPGTTRRPQRPIFGLAVYQNRLYYAVADGLQIWSVGLNSDGSFGTDAVIELAVPPAPDPTEISKITFDEQGRMVLAERPGPTGAFDFEALAVPAIGRVLRYALIDTTAERSAPLAAGRPTNSPSDSRPSSDNGNGGVAIGYNYDANGNLNPGSCGGFCGRPAKICVTPRMPALSATLARSGALDVAGLQGNGSWLVRPANAPPLASYFIDYVDEYDDPAARGYMGDIAIERLCSPAQPAAPLPFRGLPPAFPTGGKPGRPAGHAAKSACMSAVEDLRIARHTGLPARTDHSCGHEQLRAELPAPRSPDQRQVLLRHLDCGQRRLLEFELPVRANRDRPEQFLLRQQPGLCRRKRRPGVLQRKTRERQVLDADTQSANIELRQGLCSNRQRLLPGEQGDIDRGLLPGRRGAKRAEQKPVRKDRPRSDRTAMLHVGNSDRQRQMLRTRECDDRRRLLLGSRRSEKPQGLHVAHSAGRLRFGLYQNAGRLLLQ